MPTSRRTVAWLVILLWIIPGVAFGQRVRLLGRIVDPAGKPIPGVTVTATSPEVPNFKKVETTDKKGTFTLDLPQVGVTYHYQFEKDGFATLVAQQKWDLEGSQRFDWTMQPGQSTVAAGPPPASTSEDAILAYNAGVLAVRGKDYKTAVTKFKESVTHDPKLVQGWIALASAQFQQKDYKDAADSAEKAVALGSKDPGLMQTRYEAYKAAGETEKAAAALKDLESAGRATEEAKKLHNEGVALAKSGDNVGAITKFKEALALDPTLLASQVGLSQAAFKAGQFAEAATAAEAILKEDPKNDQALKLRYNACLQLGDQDRLASALIGLYAVDPAVAKAGLLKLAVDAYYDANSKDHGRANFLKLLEWDPNQPFANYYMALFYVADGKNAEAKAHLEKVVAVAPNTPQGASAKDMLKQLENIK
jgi:Tfp pilus assembly protein PilF